MDDDGSKAARDYRDLQDETAGRETGRPKRFTERDPDIDPKTGEKKSATGQLHRQLVTQRLQEIRDAAARDAYGRLVFMSRDGVHAFYEDGSELSAEEIRAVDWKDNAPKWEEYRSARDAFEELPEQQEATVSPELPKGAAPVAKSLVLKF